MTGTAHPDPLLPGPAGIYSIRAAGAPPALQLLINGAPAAARAAGPGGGAAGQAFTFLAIGAGPVTLDVVCPDPPASLDLELRSPVTGAWARIADWGPAPPPPSALGTPALALSLPELAPPGPGIVTSAAWSVYWNESAPAAGGPSAAALAAAPAAALARFGQAAAASALDLPPGGLRALVLPTPSGGGARAAVGAARGAAGVVGAVVGGVNVPVTGSSYVFKVRSQDTCAPNQARSPGCTAAPASTQLRCCSAGRSSAPGPLCACGAGVIAHVRARSQPLIRR